MDGHKGAPHRQQGYPAPGPPPASMGQDLGGHRSGTTSFPWARFPSPLTEAAPVSHDLSSDPRGLLAWEHSGLRVCRLDEPGLKITI